MQQPLSTEKNTRNNQKGAKIFYAVSLGLELGFLIALPLVVFLLLGLYLDRKFNTLPLFLVLSLLLNSFVTIFGVRKLILPFLEKRSQGKNN